MAPAAMLLHARGELLTLRGSEHFGGVAKGLCDAARRLLGELQMLGAQSLDRGPVDAVLREQLERFPARLAYPLAQRQQAACFTIGASFCFCSSVASIST